jgi:XTP/dITP diphosphohydrolase
MIPLVLASQNPKKLEELRSLLQDLPFRAIPAGEFGNNPPRVAEDGDTFEDNAVKKALTIARWSGEIALADDSGLCVDALSGAPGVRSARFAGEDAGDRDNCEKLLRLMEGAPAGNRGAEFVCVIAIAKPDGKLLGVVRGACRGTIETDYRGGAGFGYDPLFKDPESGRRFAELSPEEKNAISHRGRALAEARRLLKAFAKSRRGKSHIDKEGNLI